MLSKTEAKLFKFLSRARNQNLFGNEIARQSGVSKGAASSSLRHLTELGLLLREKVGRDFFYCANSENPLAKHLKISNSLYEVEPLVSELKKTASKIILYGSCATGDDFEDSDIDIAAISKEKESTKKAARNIKLPRKLSAIVLSPSEFLSLKARDPSFYAQVSAGLVLWRETECQTNSQHVSKKASSRNKI